MHVQLCYLGKCCFFFINVAKSAENKPIKITLPDGTSVDGVAWKTTPYEVAASIRLAVATIDFC